MWKKVKFRDPVNGKGIITGKVFISDKEAKFDWKEKDGFGWGYLCSIEEASKLIVK